MNNTGVCLSFKLELIKGIHQENHIFKLALLKNIQNVDTSIVSYLQVLDNEVDNGNGYETGGKELQKEYKLIDTSAVILLNDIIKWENCNFSVCGALIYNDSLDTKNSVAFFDFEQEYILHNETFEINFTQVSDEMYLLKIM